MLDQRSDLIRQVSKHLSYLCFDYYCEQINNIVQTNRQNNSMSKIPLQTKLQQPRTSIRNLKLNKITKHIDNWLALTQNRSNITQEKQNSGNHSSNASPAQQIKQASINQIHRLDSQNKQLKQRITILEEAYGQKQVEINTLLSQKAELEQIIKYLQTENTYLREQDTIRNSATIKDEQHSPTIFSGNIPEANQSLQDIWQQTPIESAALIELHSENSRLLQKIMQLTYGANQTTEACSQTEDHLTKHTLFPVDHINIDQIQKFCTQNQLKISSAQFLASFRDQIEKYLCREIQKQTNPLRCEIQLLEEIVKSNKKQHQQKISLMRRLLEEAQKTIWGLMDKVREFEQDSKKYYHLYLCCLRKDASLE